MPSPSKMACEIDRWCGDLPRCAGSVVNVLAGVRPGCRVDDVPGKVLTARVLGKAATEELVGLGAVAADDNFVRANM